MAHLYSLMGLSLNESGWFENFSTSSYLFSLCRSALTPFLQLSCFSSCPCFGDLRVIWMLVLARAPLGTKEEKTRVKLVHYVRCFRSLRQRRRRPHCGWNEELSLLPANMACGSLCCSLSSHHDGKEPGFCLSTCWSVNSEFNGLLQREIRSSS